MVAGDSATAVWARLDGAAFGIVYGAIVVLSILLAENRPLASPFETAVILFSSVLAITLAEAFAELMGTALRTGERITRQSLRSAWHHSTPTLAAANAPTALFAASGLGWFGRDVALWASQGLCITLLAFVGARTGWVLDRRFLPSALGALFAGGIGLLLSIAKHAIH